MRVRAHAARHQEAPIEPARQPRRPRVSPVGQSELGACWSLPARQVVAGLATSVDGLSSAEAASRLARIGGNELKEQRGLSRARVLWNQLRSPLLLLLLFAAAASAATREWVDAWIVLAIVLA